VTSATTRADVEDAAFLAGVKDPQKMHRLLRVVDQYAYWVSRKMTMLEDSYPEEPVPDKRIKYKCPECQERYAVDLFPPGKRENTAHPYDCLGCGGADRKLYKCPVCDLPKPVADFPEAKRKAPHLRVPCNWCSPRTVTHQDAGYARKR